MRRSGGIATIILTLGHSPFSLTESATGTRVKDATWNPQTVWKFWRRGKTLATGGNRRMVPPLFTPKHSHYTKYANLATTSNLIKTLVQDIII
jgi:hypothetical protein